MGYFFGGGLAVDDVGSQKIGEIIININDIEMICG